MNATPVGTVRSWWTAMQDQDVEALRALVLVDLVSAGGPETRSLGRNALLDGAREFFAAGRIDDWSLSDMEVREHGDAAVCSYLWRENGAIQEQPFLLRGIATDILFRAGGIWRYQAHHVSILPDTTTTVVPGYHDGLMPSHDH